MEEKELWAVVSYEIFGQKASAVTSRPISGAEARKLIDRGRIFVDFEDLGLDLSCTLLIVYEVIRTSTKEEAIEIAEKANDGNIPAFEAVVALNEGGE